MMLSSKFARHRGRKKLSKHEMATADRQRKKPDYKEFLAKQDWTGALVVLEHEKAAAEEGKEKDDFSLWLAYSAFHLGDYKRALDEYTALVESTGDETLHLFRASCLYYLQMYDEAKKAAQKGPTNPLQNRILFHISHRQNDETSLMLQHQKLSTSLHDQLSLAAIHYLRGHFQEATDIYKRLLLEDRDNVALNVYVAMCYYKLDYYDVSLEILAVYLQANPTSIIAVNLKACNHFRLYNGRAAETEMKALTDKDAINIADHDILNHNLVVFRGGQNALQVLPPLVDYLPEARLNLVVYYLRNDETSEAEALMRDMEPATPQEYILKGVVNAMMGQQAGSREHLKVAQQFFQLVGSSASECDTIPGRQCMASCFFLLRQFEDVNIYLKSIKAYMYNDDDFNWNFGISLANVNEFKEAEDTLLLVQNESYRSEYTFVSWLARCYIMNGKAKNAWDLYLKMDTSNESFNLLQLIANDCYKMGAFYYAAKAFDVLERLDPDPEYWEGKRGACVGVLQQVIANKAPVESLRDVISMLRNTMNPQVEYIIRVMNKYLQDNHM